MAVWTNRGAEAARALVAEVSGVSLSYRSKPGFESRR